MAKVKDFTASEAATRPSTSLELEELLRPVHGFFVHVSTEGVDKIENVTDESALEDPAYKIGDETHFFWLVGGEHVVEVVYTARSVKYMRSSTSLRYDRIKAIRFRTNLRASQWFGVPDGSMFTYTADKAHRIHAMCVQSVNGYCSKLNAVVLPFASPSPQEEPPQLQIQQVITSQDTGRAFRSCSRTVRAVVIDSNVFSIMVLSTEEYDRYGALQESVKLKPGEHVEELIPGEKILGINCTTDATGLSALRLVTTHRTTPWFGNPNNSERLSFKCDGTKGAYICGFNVVVGSSKRVVALSVMVAPAPESS